MKKIQALTIVLLIILGFNSLYSQDASLWGMVETGGLYGGGSVYKLDQDTDEITEVYHFNKFLNSPESHMLKASNGMFYGYTKAGLYKKVIYRYDPILDTAFLEYRFQDGNGIGSLIEYSDELLIGHSATHIFSYNIILKEYTNLGSFEDIGGDEIAGKLIKSSNNKIYGHTKKGGAYNKGIIFEYDFSTQMITKLFEFNGFSNGAYPYGDMVEASNGKIYGVTSSGGSLSDGVLYEFNIETHQYNKRKEFGGATYLRPPLSGLVEAANGKLYGWIDSCNYYPNYHCIFSYDYTSNDFRIEQYYNESEFGLSSRNGIHHVDTMIYNLVRHSSGGMYHWKVLRYNPFTNHDTIIDLNMSTNHAHLRGFSIANDHSFYLNSSVGGAKDLGELFLYDFISNSTESKYSFGMNNCGKKPMGSFFMRSNGKLYAETSEQGNFGFGIMFEIDPNTGNFKKILDFEEENIYSIESMIETENGKCFGISRFGGPDDSGLIFEFDFDTYSFNILYKFNDSESLPYDGKYPLNIRSYMDGMLYGTTQYGGGYDYGTIFKFNPESLEYAKVFDFERVYFGDNPQALLKLDEESLYVHCLDGGSSYSGVFEHFDPLSGIVSPKIYFDNSSFYKPYSPIIKSPETGKICYFTNENYNKKYYCIYDYKNDIFNKTLMPDHYGFLYLMAANNGMLYGINGTYIKRLYKFDINSNTLIEILPEDSSIDFDDISGIPVEVCKSSQTVLNQPILPDIIGECSIEMPTVPTAMNDCGHTIYATSSHDFPITSMDTTIVIWTYTTFADTLEQSQMLIIYDSIPPTALSPDTLIIECGENIPDPDINVITNVSDNCSSDPIVEWIEDVSDNNTYPETIARKYSVSDDAGNSIMIDHIILFYDISNVQLTIVDDNVNLVPGVTFATELQISGAQNLAGFELELGFDPLLVQANSIELSGFLESTGRTIFPLNESINNTNGILEYAVMTLGPEPDGPSGDGVLITIEWTIDNGVSEDDLLEIVFNNCQMTQPDAELMCIHTQDLNEMVYSCLPYDLDCDCDVDIIDVTMGAYHYGAVLGDDLYDPVYDLDSDGDIDIIDMTMLSYNYGWSCGSKLWLPELEDWGNDNVQIGFGHKQLIDPVHSIYELELYVENVWQLGAYELELGFNSEELIIESIELGCFIESSHREAFPLEKTIDNNKGSVKVAVTTLGSSIKGVDGGGVLLKLKYQELSEQLSGFSFESGRLLRIDAHEIYFKLNMLHHQNENNTHIINIQPNPFNDEILIKYEVSKKGRIDFKLFNAQGKFLEVIEKEINTIGEYELKLGQLNLSSGVYILSMYQDGIRIESQNIVKE